MIKLSPGEIQRIDEIKERVKDKELTPCGEDAKFLLVLVDRAIVEIIKDRTGINIREKK